MAITLNGTTGISSPGGDTSTSLATTNLSYTGTLTGGTGVIAIGTNQIYKDASGNLGIGTSSPLYRLHSYGGNVTNPTNFYSQGYIANGAVDTRCGTIRNGFDTNTDYGTYWTAFRGASGSTYQARFGVRFTGTDIDVMTIDSSGNLLVGTTSIVSGFSGIAQIEASGSQGGIVINSATNNLARLIFTSNNTPGNEGLIRYDTSNSSMQFWTAATERASISGSGVFKINNLAGTGSRAVNADASGNLSAASDSSLKQEDKGVPLPGLKEILKITPRAYKWLADIENRGDEAATEIGFFADEVAPIIPSAAPKCADGLYGFYDRSVTAALVKAIQELTTRLEALEAQ